MIRTTFHAKNTSKNLSQQVKEILNERGLSLLFNFNDYTHFKTQCTNAFNKAQAIAEKFIEENQEAKSDFNEYVF
jgi:hypothetical protein